MVFALLVLFNSVAVSCDGIITFKAVIYCAYGDKDFYFNVGYYEEDTFKDDFLVETKASISEGQREVLIVSKIEHDGDGHYDNSMELYARLNHTCHIKQGYQTIKLVLPSLPADLESTMEYYFVATNRTVGKYHPRSVKIISHD